MAVPEAAMVVRAAKADRAAVVRAAPADGRAASANISARKKVCKFCVEKMDFIDYKRADILSQFVQERGKILPRRMTGVCSRHQRWLGVAIKRARNIAMLPFAGSAAGSQALRAVAPHVAHAAPATPSRNSCRRTRCGRGPEGVSLLGSMKTGAIGRQHANHSSGRHR